MTLNQREESFIRQMVKEHTPLVAQNPVQTGLSSNHVSVDAVIDKALANTPKMQVKDLNDDPLVESKLRHVLRQKESLGAFYSRVGLGRSAILAMSREEILRFVEVREANADDVREPRSNTRDSFVAAPVARQLNAVMVGE